MHFISLAALAATAFALPSKLVENNKLEAVAGKALLITENGAQEIHEKRDPQQRHTLPMIGTPYTSSTTSRSTTSSSRTTTSSLRTTTSSSRTTTSSVRPTTTSSVRPTTTTTSSRVTTSTSTSATTSPPGTLPLTLQQRALDAHNVHRRNHSAPAVTWDDAIARSAMTLAQRCVFQHNTSIDGGGYGQNIAAGLTADRISQSINDLWYNGEFNAYLPSYYGTEPDMSKFASFGHFTQVVWNTTTAIGCFVADCTKSGLGSVGSNVPPYLTVCNYKPPGNYVGSFGKSIGRPLGQPTVSG